jgi:hypothetical protein
MKTYVSGLGILLLVGGLAVACTESDTGRIGERPSERRPSASPPMTPMTPPDTPGRSPATPDKAETPPPAVTPPTGTTDSGGSK